MSVFDLDALFNESTKEDFKFKLGGKEFTMKDPSSLPVKAIRLIDVKAKAGDEDGYLEAYFGKDLEEVLELVNGKQLEAVIEACNDYYGLDMGKSEDSSKSAKSTRKK